LPKLRREFLFAELELPKKLFKHIDLMSYFCSIFFRYVRTIFD